jgi:hypothetical protein
MSHDPDVFGYLATSKISEITTALLDDSTKNTYANKSNVKFWKGPISIWATVRATRTYPGGLEIPETGAIAQTIVTAGESEDLRPTGTELWRVKGIFAIATGGVGTVNISYTDGSTVVPIRVGVSVATAGTIIDLNEVTTGPVTLSNTLYLDYTETGNINNVSFSTAYYKVSL